MRKPAALAAIALLTASCATLGREYPRCDFQFADIPISIIMELQALPDAGYGPCLNDLAPGWSYHHMHHETGRVTFWLDSDRLGDRFVEVTMTESCDPGSAAGRAHPNPDIRRFVEATEELQPVDVVIVPIGESAVDYAAAVGVDLAGTSVRGRPLALTLDNSDDPLEAVEDAGSRGAFAIGVDDIDPDMVYVVAPDGEVEFDLNLEEAVKEIGNDVEEGSYQATWFHLFEGGCVTFDFDADGAGVETLVGDIEAAIGFADLAGLKEEAAAFGIVIDESELDD